MLEEYPDADINIEARLLDLWNKYKDDIYQDNPSKFLGKKK